MWVADRENDYDGLREVDGPHGQGSGAGVDTCLVIGLWVGGREVAGRAYEHAHAPVEFMPPPVHEAPLHEHAHMHDPALTCTSLLVTQPTSHRTIQAMLSLMSICLDTILSTIDQSNTTLSITTLSIVCLWSTDQLTSEQ